MTKIQKLKLLNIEYWNLEFICENHAGTEARPTVLSDVRLTLMLTAKLVEGKIPQRENIGYSINQKRPSNNCFFEDRVSNIQDLFSF